MSYINRPPPWVELGEQRGRGEFLEATELRVRTQSAQFSPFANPDVNSKTAAGFANRPCPPNQLGDPLGGEVIEIVAHGPWFRCFPRAQYSLQILSLAKPTYGEPP